MSEQLPQPPTSASSDSWSNTAILSQPQDGLIYLQQQVYIPTSQHIPHPFDVSYRDEHLPQASSSNEYSASPSPSPFPPSPTYLSVHTASPSPSVDSISYSEAFPDILDTDVFENLSLSPQQYSSTSPPFCQASPVHLDQAVSTRPLSLYGGSVDISAGISTAMHTPRSTGFVHSHQHHFEPRTASYLSPYSRHHSIICHPVSFDNYGYRQVSAPTSPSASPLTATSDSDPWLHASQHRRTVSVDHVQGEEYDRRYSEGDIAASYNQLSTSFFSESTSTSIPQTSQELFSSSSSQVHPDGLIYSNSGSPESSTHSGTSAKRGSNAFGVYKCGHEGCTKTFTRPYNLNSHAKTHTNDRPYPCGQCDRQFARLHDKNRHERLHRGERPFACARCHHPFARTDALNRHLKVDGGRNPCNKFLMETDPEKAMPIVDMPPKKINPLILAHFPNFGKDTSDDEASSKQP